MTEEEKNEPLRKCEMEVALLRDAYFQLKNTTKEFSALQVRYQEILERLPVAVYSMTGSPNPVATYLSPRFFEWVGLEQHGEKSITLEKFMETVHEDDRMRLSEKLKEANEKGLSYEIEYRVVDKKTGYVRHIRDMASKTKVSGIARFDGVMIDITDEVRLREEAKERLADLERFTHLTVGREMKMVELKEKLKELEDDQPEE